MSGRDHALLRTSICCLGLAAAKLLTANLHFLSFLVPCRLCWRCSAWRRAYKRQFGSPRRQPFQDWEWFSSASHCSGPHHR